MTAYVIRFRTANGSWMETQVMARNNYEATQQANAMYGAQNIMGVYPAIQEAKWD